MELLWALEDELLHPVRVQAPLGDTTVSPPLNHLLLSTPTRSDAVLSSCQVTPSSGGSSDLQTDIHDITHNLS